jgi:hypothetical protein
VAGQWAQVPEVIQLPTGKSFALTQYLGGLLHSDGVRELFDVTDQSGAEKIEQRELAKEEQARAVARLSQVTNTPVARAVKLATDMAVETIAHPEKTERDDGAETFTNDKREREEGEDPKPEDVEGSETSATEDTEKSARRAARAARMNAKVGAKPTDSSTK